MEFLQRRNPNTPSVIDKISPPLTRNLTEAKKLWKAIISLSSKPASQTTGNSISQSPLTGERARRRRGEVRTGGIKKIACKTAAPGQNGLDINDPQSTYKVTALLCKQNRLCALCCMYAGLKRTDPSIDAGIDLTDEYNQAAILSETGIM